MALKDMFNAMKKEGYVTAPLDRYLFEEANRPNDRAVNVNAPSQAGNCMRANYYMRMQYDKDGSTDPRAQRIFDNGTYTHERLQAYLLDMELLLMDEVPLINEEYNIQGHTDGFLGLVDEKGIDEVAILEIKSINDNQFSQLKDAKEEHKKQGLVYLYCAEERRRWLHEHYKTPKEFNDSYEERYKYFESKYQHMKDGSHYTRKEKIENERNLLALNLNYTLVYYHSDSAEFCNNLQKICRFILKHPGEYYVHSRQGIDSTGVVSAVIAALCGAKWAEICEDFERTDLAGFGNYRSKKLLRYSIKKMIGFDPEYAKDLSHLMQSYFIKEDIPSADEISQLVIKLNVLPKRKERDYFNFEKNHICAKRSAKI